MKQQNQCVGLGKIVNGRKSYVGSHNGQMGGFSRPIEAPVAHIIRKEAPVQASVITEESKRQIGFVLHEEKELEIPDFMMNRRKAAPTTARIIQVNFERGDVEKEEQDAGEIVELIVEAVKKKIESTKVFKFFFGEGEE